MPGKLVVSLTRAKDDPDRVTVAFVVANAAVASDKETVVFLSTEGTRLSQKGYADDIHEDGFAPLAELMTNFAKAGGTISRRLESDITRDRGVRSSLMGRMRAT